MTDILKVLENRFLAPRMGAKGQALLAKRLSMLVRSHMSLPSAFRSLAAGQPNAGIREALVSVAARVEEGQTASAAISPYPRIFPPLARAMMAVGEASGTLSESLSSLADELRKRDRLREQLLGAFLYPSLLAVLTVAVSGCLIAFVFPKIIPLFSGLGTELPLPTRILLSLYSFAGTWGLWTLGALAILAVAAVRASRAEHARKRMASALMRAPLLGRLLRDYQIALVTRSLGVLLRSGMPFPDALAGAGASGSILYREALLHARELVERGESVQEAFNEHPHLFPKLAGDLLLAGELGAGLAESAFHLAEYHEHEFAESTRRLAALAEPLLMIGMGLVVGFVSIAMILPIYAITDGLTAR